MIVPGQGSPVTAGDICKFVHDLEQWVEEETAWSAGVQQWIMTHGPVSGGGGGTVPPPPPTWPPK